MFLFAAISMALCTVLCGLIPAWRLSHIEPQESLKAGGGNPTEGGRKMRFHHVMVGFEVVLSTVLLTVGLLLMASFVHLIRQDNGFEVAHIITQDVSFLSPKYSHGVRRGFIEEIANKLAQIPGVQSGRCSQLPLLGEGWSSGLQRPDNPQAPVQDKAMANFRFVTPDISRPSV